MLAQVWLFRGVNMLHAAKFQVSPWANPRLNELQDIFNALSSTALKEEKFGVVPLVWFVNLLGSQFLSVFCCW